jgi:hypothetical protein
MKTLVISGSPRKNGHAMTLVNEMTNYLNGKVRTLLVVYLLLILASEHTLPNLPYLNNRVIQVLPKVFSNMLKAF